MSAAVEMPADIRDTAKAIAEQPWLTRAERDRMAGQIAKAINEAVMAERERCAALLENTSARLRVRRSGPVTESVAGVLNDCATVIRMPAAPKAEG